MKIRLKNNYPKGFHLNCMDFNLMSHYKLAQIENLLIKIK